MRGLARNLVVGGALLGGSAGLLVSSTTTAYNSSAEGERRRPVFTWPELERGIAERKRHAKELQAVSGNAKQRLGELAKQLETKKITPSEYETRFTALRKEIVDRAETIVWGATGRDAYLREHGCVKINPEAIAAIKELNMGVVEMGAGAGHWAKALKDAGVDVVAFDSDESLPIPDEQKKFNVKRGDPSVLSKHKNRALLLVYPPPGSMAEASVKAHSGAVVVYCGEGRGGVNASKEFFDILEDKFIVTRQVEKFEQFGTKSFERLWVLRRQ